MNMGPVYQTADCGIMAPTVDSVSDQKYMIIPDQLVVALAVTAIGFVPFH